MYVENVGNPARFVEIAGRITKTKAISVVKSGRSQAGVWSNGRVEIGSHRFPHADQGLHDSGCMARR
jgi:hypothetical protein